MQQSVVGVDQQIAKKTLASPKMSKVRVLSPYMNNRKLGEAVGVGPASGH